MKTLLLVCMMAFCGVAYAQTSTDSTANIPDQLRKGTSRIGLGFTYSKNSGSFNNPGYYSDYGADGYFIRGNYGLMVSGKTQVGIVLGFGSNKGNSSSNSSIIDNRFNQYIGGLYVRQYLPILKRLAAYGQINSDYSYGKTNYDGNIDTRYTKTNGIQANLGGGLAYFSKKHWSVEMGLNLLSFNHANIENATDNGVQGTVIEKQKTTNIALNPFDSSAFTLGIFYYFGGKN